MTGGPGNETLSWRTLDEYLVFASKELPRLIALWESKCRGDRLPARADFEADELMRMGGFIALIDVQQEPERFRFRLIGTGITEMLGRDSTGLYLDELYDADKYDIAVEGYRYCIAHRRPARARGRMVHANMDLVHFESVDLPLAGDGRTVDMIMKGAHYL